MVLKTCLQGKIILLCYLDKALKIVSNSGALEQKVGEKKSYGYYYSCYFPFLLWDIAYAKTVRVQNIRTKSK